jgi:hypothetical protein
VSVPVLRSLHAFAPLRAPVLDSWPCACSAHRCSPVSVLHPHSRAHGQPPQAIIEARRLEAARSSRQGRPSGASVGGSVGGSGDVGVLAGGGTGASGDLEGVLPSGELSLRLGVLAGGALAKPPPSPPVTPMVIVQRQVAEGATGSSLFPGLGPAAGGSLDLGPSAATARALPRGTSGGAALLTVPGAGFARGSSGLPPRSGHTTPVLVGAGGSDKGDLGELVLDEGGALPLRGAGSGAGVPASPPRPAHASVHSSPLSAAASGAGSVPSSPRLGLASGDALELPLAPSGDGVHAVLTGGCIVVPRVAT